MARRLLVAWVARCGAAILVSSVIILVPPAVADTFKWANATGGDFAIAGNWTNTTGVDPAPPNAGDTAVFNIADTYTVTFNADASSDLLDFDDGAVTFNSSGGTRTYLLTTGDADALIDGGELTLSGMILKTGDDLFVRNSTLFVNNGSDVTATDQISVATSFGDAEIRVDDSSINFGGQVRLGLSGFAGTLTLQNGSTGIIGGVTGFGRSGSNDSKGFLNVLSGSTLTTGQLLVGDVFSATGHEAILTVDGMNSALTMSGASTLTVGDSSNNNVQAELRVFNNGTFNTGMGNATIQNTGLLDVNSGGTFNANGALVVRFGATLSLDGGAVNANTGLDASDGVLDFRDGTLTVTGGAFAPNAGGPADDYEIDGLVPSDLPHLVLDAGATANIGRDLFVARVNRGELTVTSGGEVSNTIGFVGHLTGSNGTVIVSGTDGSGNASKWINSSFLIVGNSGIGSLTIAGGGEVINTMGQVGGFSVGNGNVIVSGTDGSGNASKWMNFDELSVGNAGNGTLNILGGGEVSNSHGIVGGHSGANGDVTVSGTDGSGNASKWINSVRLFVGKEGIGSLTIDGGGEVSNTGNGTVGELTGSNGTVNVSGTDGSGKASKWINSSGLFVGKEGIGSLTIEGGGEVSNANALVGQLTGSKGTVTVTGTGSNWINSADLFVGGTSTTAGGTGSLTLQDSGLVQVDGTFKIWTDGTVDLDGGTLDLNGPIEDCGGTFNFTRGQLNMNDASQTVLVTTSGVSVNGLLLNPAPSLVLDANRGLSVAGETIVGPGATLRVDGGSASLGGLTLATGGTVSYDAGTFSSTGRVQAGIGSTINIAGGDVSLGDSTEVNGFGSAGTLNVGANTVTLLDANDAVFDSLALVTLNAGTGTLDAANGLTLDFGGNIAGFGTVDTPNNVATPLINNGNITGNDPNAPITLTGHVKGVGTCDNCNITGTDAPGFSTAAVNRGTVSYNGKLEIEIGGLTPGSDFDQLNHILGAGIADLGGTLDVSLLGGFAPSLGDMFEIITAGSVVDSFDVELLPDLGGLDWSVIYGATSVVLEVVADVDVDNDGDVDGRDFLLIQRNDPALIPQWETEFGNGPGAVSSPTTAVPEPAGGTLAALALAAWFARKRGKSRFVSHGRVNRIYSD